MLLKALMVAVAAALLGAAYAQLELGVLSALYYPPPAPPARHPPPAPPTRHPPPPRPCVLRSYFDRDSAPAEGNDAALRRVMHKLADPRWTPHVGPRARWT